MSDIMRETLREETLMINRKILEHVRGDLIEKMDQLRDKVNRTAVRMKGGSDRFADFVDQAAVDHEQAVELMIRSRESDQIREIQATLLRIDQGSFGVCGRCGRGITPKRLLLAPMSRLCTACMRRMELQRRFRDGQGPVYRVVDHHAA
jgi:DnaK suppressor protein